MTDVHSMTIREWLQAHGGVDRVVCKILEAHLDLVPTNIQLCGTPGTGFLQHLCGGDCIVRFNMNSRGYLIYLVRDDWAGQAWDAERRLGKSGLSRRPFAQLQLVQPG